MNANPASGLQDLEQRLPRLGPTRVLVALDLSAGLAWLAAVLSVGDVRRWSAAHPVTLSFGVGLMLLVITVFTVERWLAINESRRWRAPALMALDAYVFAADRVVRRIQERLSELVKALPNPQRSEPRVPDALALLLEQQCQTARTGRWFGWPSSLATRQAPWP